MKITSLHIDEFGPLKNFDLSLSDGINIIEGDNESGKSSVLLFIRFMMYGLAKKQRSDAVSETDRAVSWDTSSAKGTLNAVKNGTEYRIERCAVRHGALDGRISESLQVVECESGRICSEITEPGLFFLGIPADIFISTCAVGQMQCADIGGHKTSSALENLLSSADETVDVNRALKTLDRIRVGYLHKNRKGGSVFELEQKVAALEAQYSTALADNTELEALELKLCRMAATIEALMKKKGVADRLDSGINQLSALHMFERKREYEKRLEERRRALEGLRADIGGGFVPDDAYLADLNSALRECEIAQREYQNDSERLKALDADSRADSEAVLLGSRVRDMGGVDAIVSRRKKYLSMFRVMLVPAAVCGILCVAGAVAAITGSFGSAATMGIISTACAALCALFVSLAFVLKKRSGAQLETLGIGTENCEEELKKCTAAYESSIARQKELADCEARCATKQKILDDALLKARTVLSRISDTPADSDSASLADALRGTARRVEKFLRESKEAENDISALSADISELGLSLGGYSEERLRSELPPEILSMTEKEIERARLNKSFIYNELEMLSKQKAELERRAIEKRSVSKNPFRLAAELEAVRERLRTQSDNHDAVMLAYSSIEEASKNLRGNIVPKLTSLAESATALATGNKYPELGISESLEVSLPLEGFTRPVDVLSQGTRDVLYIALRLSLLRIIPSDSPLPVFLDESLAMVDNGRSVNILRLLSDYCRDGGQCVLFSCHDRESELCVNNGIQFRKTVI